LKKSSCWRWSPRRRPLLLTFNTMDAVRSQWKWISENVAMLTGNILLSPQRAKDSRHFVLLTNNTAAATLVTRRIWWWQLSRNKTPMRITTQATQKPMRITTQETSKKQETKN
jgi:hypothetical protein